MGDRNTKSLTCQAYSIDNLVHLYYYSGHEKQIRNSCNLVVDGDGSVLSNDVFSHRQGGVNFKKGGNGNCG